MNNLAAISLAIFLGALTSIQAAINAELGKHIGGIAAALISFSVGTITLGLFYLFSAEEGIKGVAKVSPYLLIGGCMGAILVFGMIKLVPLIGVSSSIAGVIFGQLVLAMIIDHFGLFGLTQYSVNWTRGLGVVLLLLGVNLITK